VIKYLTLDEMENDTHNGVPVSWVGDEGDAIAFTDDVQAGEAAILAMARRDLGVECVVTGYVRAMWMRFHVEEGYLSDEWQGELCRESDEGAMRVVRAEGVSDLASLELSS
jgi:hypothetical protein